MRYFLPTSIEKMVPLASRDLSHLDGGTAQALAQLVDYKHSMAMTSNPLFSALLVCCNC